MLSERFQWGSTKCVIADGLRDAAETTTHVARRMTDKGAATASAVAATGAATVSVVAATGAATASAVASQVISTSHTPGPISHTNTRPGQPSLLRSQSTCGNVFQHHLPSHASVPPSAKEETMQTASPRRSSVDPSAHQQSGAEQQQHANLDAIQSFSVVATLVLGFSVSALIAVACELTDELRSGTLSVFLFAVLMSVATVMSSYATVFFTLEVYYLRRLVGEGGEREEAALMTFLHYTGSWRRLARVMTVGA
jgi:hypothetical protein